MVKNSAACIRNARQTKHYITFSDIEFEYVSGCKELSSTEKLIWFNLARKAYWDPEFSCQLTHQMLADAIGSKPHTVYRALRRLKEEGFINVSFNANLQVNTYKVILPNSGIKAIENAPLRGGKRESVPNVSAEKSKNEKSGLSSNLQPAPHKSAGSLPANLSNILIKNNNINIHNSHELCVDKFQESNCDETVQRLLAQFEMLQQEAKELGYVERIRYINSHFTIDEIAMISRKLSENQSNYENARVQQGNQEKLIFKAKPISSEKLVNVCFDGENFLVEEAVKDEILRNIPSLHRNNKIKGSAALKPLDLLLKEIFFYVANAGRKSSASQLKRYYLARKICLKGDWEQPKGMELKEITDKENSWHLEKLKEIRASENVLKSLGSI